jgi:hypothetical protein
MSFRVRAITALALVASAAGSAQSTDESAAYLYVGTHNGSAYHVNIRGTKVLYRTGLAGIEVTTRWEIIELPASTVDNYFKRLRQIGVFSWRNEYSCNVMDGTSWSVEVFDNGSDFYADGSNDFPPRFDELLRLTSELISRPFDAPVRPCTNRFQ